MVSDPDGSFSTMMEYKLSMIGSYFSCFCDGGDTAGQYGECCCCCCCCCGIFRKTFQICLHLSSCGRTDLFRRNFLLGRRIIIKLSARYGYVSNDKRLHFRKYHHWISVVCVGPSRVMLLVVVELVTGAGSLLP